MARNITSLFREKSQKYMIFQGERQLTENPAQKGHECLTLGDVVRAKAAKLTAKMRLPSTICETPRESMMRVRVRNSLSRERLRDRDTGLRERPLGIALTGMVATKQFK